MKQRKVLLFANTDWYLYNFRRSLAETLRLQGWEVVLVSPPGKYGPKMQALGFCWLPFPFSTRSTNFLTELGVIARLIMLYRRERPDFCHHFTIKCVIYGSIAARMSSRPPVVNGVTGMGHIFTDQGVKAGLLRPLVRILYRFVFGDERSRIIFQNKEDMEYFTGSGILGEDRARVIRGSGVNTDVFKRGVERSRKIEQTVSVLFASRIIREKGVFELIEAARLLKARELDAEFLLAGDLYPENPSSLTAAEIEEVKQAGIVSYLGHVDDIRGLLDRCDIVVLPSYREGTPRILIEAAAMEKPLVATDIAGCAGLVLDGKNGFLVPVRDSPALADAIEKLVRDKELRQNMGRAGREIVLRDFDESIVLRKTLDVYGELITL